jgi:hypothetical protein
MGFFRGLLERVGFVSRITVIAVGGGKGSFLCFFWKEALVAGFLVECYGRNVRRGLVWLAVGHRGAMWEETLELVRDVFYSSCPKRRGIGISSLVVAPTEFRSLTLHDWLSGRECLKMRLAFRSLWNHFAPSDDGFCLGGFERSMCNQGITHPFHHTSIRPFSPVVLGWWDWSWENASPSSCLENCYVRHRGSNVCSSQEPFF